MSSIPPPLAYPHPGPPPELPELPEGVVARVPHWAAWTAPVALVAGFGGAIMGALLIGAIAGATGASLHHPPSGVEIGATVFQDLALIASAVIFARMWGRPRGWHFGLRSTPFWPAAKWLALVWAGFFAFSIAWSAALGLHERENLPDELGAGNSTAGLIAVALLVTVVAPIAEEFFFRGYFFSALRTWKGPWLAAVITGLVFGGIHAGSAPVGFLVPLAAFGFGLCLLYWRTGSLYPCMALHAFNNALAFGVSEHWQWWQVLVAMAVSPVVILALVRPFGSSAGLRGRRERPAATGAWRTGARAPQRRGGDDTSFL